MHTSTKARLTQLNARVSKRVTEFVANPDEQKSSTLRNAAIAAGGAGLAYGGASILRGRSWQKNVLGQADNSASGLLGALKTGHAMNKVDAAKVASSVGGKVVAKGRDAQAMLLRAQRRLTPLLKK